MAYYSGHPALHPSGQLKLFKIVPDDFVAPNSKHREDVTPAKRGKGRPHEEHGDKTPEQRHQAMTPDQVRGRLWAQRLKRVLNIDVSVRPKCGGEAKVIASIEDQQIIDKIPSLGP